MFVTNLLLFEGFLVTDKNCLCCIIGSILIQRSRGRHPAPRPLCKCFSRRFDPPSPHWLPLGPVGWLFQRAQQGIVTEKRTAGNLKKHSSMEIDALMSRDEHGAWSTLAQNVRRYVIEFLTFSCWYSIDIFSHFSTATIIQLFSSFLVLNLKP